MRCANRSCYSIVPPRVTPGGNTKKYCSRRCNRNESSSRYRDRNGIGIGGRGMYHKQHTAEYIKLMEALHNSNP